jgi:hypothetical protein
MSLAAFYYGMAHAIAIYSQVRSAFDSTIIHMYPYLLRIKGSKAAKEQQWNSLSRRSEAAAAAS